MQAVPLRIRVTFTVSGWRLAASVLSPSFHSFFTVRRPSPPYSVRLLVKVTVLPPAAMVTDSEVFSAFPTLVVQVAPFACSVTVKVSPTARPVTVMGLVGLTLPEAVVVPPCVTVTGKEPLFSREGSTTSLRMVRLAVSRV